MSWTVTIKISARKGIDKLPEKIRRVLALLMVEIETAGPIRGNWPNYGKRGPRRHHCHLKKGRPPMSLSGKNPRTVSNSSR